MLGFWHQGKAIFMFKLVSQLLLVLVLVTGLNVPAHPTGLSQCPTVWDPVPAPWEWPSSDCTAGLVPTAWHCWVPPVGLAQPQPMPREAPSAWSCPGVLAGVVGWTQAARPCPAASPWEAPTTPSAMTVCADPSSASPTCLSMVYNLLVCSFVIFPGLMVWHLFLLECGLHLPGFLYLPGRLLYPILFNVLPLCDDLTERSNVCLNIMAFIIFISTYLLA